MLKKKISLIDIGFIVTFIMAAFLRLYKLKEFATFLGDQGRDAIIIRRIITLDHLTAIGPPSSIGQVFLGPFYYYLVAPFFPVFHFNPVGLAFAVAFYSLIGFVIAFFVIRKQVNAAAALIFSLLLAFSSVNIDFSRFSWNPNLLPLFAFLTLYFWHLTLTKKSYINAVLFGVLFACSFQLHHLALLMGFPILASLLMHLKKHASKDRLGELLKKIGVSIVGFGIISSPLVIFDLKNHFLNTTNLVKTFTQGEIITDKTLNVSLAERLSQTFVALIDHVFKINLSPTLAILLFLLCVAGLLVVIVKSNNGFIKLHAMNIVLFTLVFGLLNSQRHPHYFGTEYYSILTVLAYFLFLLIKQKAVKYLVPVILGIYIVLNAQNYYFLYKEPNNQINDGELLAKSIIPHITNSSFQLVSYPLADQDRPTRYFLEAMKHRPLEYDSPSEASEIFVLCFEEKCNPLDSHQWQVAVFKNPKIDTMWKVKWITIYKLVHEKK